MSQKKIIITLTSVCLTGFIVTCILQYAISSRHKALNTAKPLPSSQKPFQPPLRPDSMTGNASNLITGQTDANFTDRAVSQLKSEFRSNRIGKNRYMLFLQLRSYLAEKFPGSYASMFEDIIKKAFPDQAADIIRTMNRLDIYNKWLAENKSRLAQLDTTRIKDALWKKRKELFGNDANELWDEETKTEAVIDVIDIIRDSHDTTIQSKLNIYKGAIKDIYKDNTNPFLKEKKFNLARAFFSLDSVQDNLKTMNDEERDQNIRNVRMSMGYSQEETDQLSKKDADNEKKWRNGYQYMGERDKLMAAYQGQELQDKLSELQTRYFKDSARTIQAEEASGFFRFNRPRVYGRN